MEDGGIVIEVGFLQVLEKGNTLVSVFRTKGEIRFRQFDTCMAGADGFRYLTHAKKVLVYIGQCGCFENV